jgi:putative transposase
MPRRPRLHVPGAFYHVTLRGNHRQNIFFSASDRELLNEIVAEASERCVARVHAFCWMTNHIHLLIQVGDIALGRVILRIASGYARRIQRSLRTTGHLFERRYHSVLIDTDEYLLELIRYIHLNPVRAHMVQAVDQYPWSSHAAYLGNETIPWLTTDYSLRYFSTDRIRAISAYRTFIDEQLNFVESPLEQSNENDPRILGDDNFLATLLNESWKPKPRKTVEQLVTEACSHFSITREQLISPSRNRQITKACASVAHQALLLQVSSLSAVSRLFGRSESSLRESVRLHFNYP